MWHSHHIQFLTVVNSMSIYKYCFITALWFIITQQRTQFRWRYWTMVDCGIDVLVRMMFGDWCSPTGSKDRRRVPHHWHIHRWYFRGRSDAAYLFVSDIPCFQGQKLDSAEKSMVSVDNGSPGGTVCWSYFVSYDRVWASCYGPDQDVWLLYA